MARRVRHHVNPLGARFLDTSATRIASRGRPMEVELGCADARFLFERAPKHPDVDFIGVEIREPLVEEVNEKAAALGIPNLRAVFANLNTELDALFADATIRRAYVNFPDPCFKMRQRKRRLVTQELAATLARKLELGGELLFQSDVWSLGIDALCILEGEKSLRNLVGPWRFLRDNPYDSKSLREVRVEEDGVRVWRLWYARSD